MIRAVLSIGANLGDARGNIQTVLDRFAESTVAASQIFATPPWGGVEQGDFLNVIIVVDTDLSPLELLRAGQECENNAGRVRDIHWGPRTLDVDIVQITDLDTGEYVTSDDTTLTLPHPYANQRAFVLVPWLDADASAELAGVPVAELVAKLEPADVADVKVDTP